MSVTSVSEVESLVENYVATVQRTLALHIDGCVHPTDLLRILPGLFPGDLASELEAREKAFGCRSSANLLSALREGDVTRKARVRRDLVLPHPLDYEWLFTQQTSENLAMRPEVQEGASVVCVGTPSVFLALGTRKNNCRTLLDRHGVVGQMRIGASDKAVVMEMDKLSDSNAPTNADLAFVDSPWYPAHTVRFAGLAATCMRPGGMLLVVVPPPFTRPGVKDEICEMSAELERLGLVCEDLESSAVRYTTPPFELATLKSLGLYGITGDWRVGDLLRFRVRRVPTLKEVPKPTFGESWTELQVGSTRIKFKASPVDSLNTALSWSAHGEVLRSVSRRDPFRNRVSVWTSGNRAYECAAPTVLFHGMQAVASGKDPVPYCSSVLGVNFTSEEEFALKYAIDLLNRSAAEEEESIAWE